MNRSLPSTPILMLSMLALLLSANGEARAETLGRDALMQCRQIVDPTARLACFDRLADLPVADAVPPAGPAPKSASAPAAAASAAPVQNFGSDVLPPADVPQPKSISATVVGSIRGIRRGMILTLDNGQQWRVVDDREYDVDGDAVKVRLDRNAIGTYWLELLDAGYRFKVRRIK